MPNPSAAHPCNLSVLYVNTKDLTSKEYLELQKKLKQDSECCCTDKDDLSDSDSDSDSESDSTLLLTKNKKDLSDKDLDSENYAILSITKNNRIKLVKNYPFCSANTIIGQNDKGKLSETKSSDNYFAVAYKIEKIDFTSSDNKERKSIIVQNPNNPQRFQKQLTKEKMLDNTNLKSHFC